MSTNSIVIRRDCPRDPRIRLAILVGKLENATNNDTTIASINIAKTVSILTHARDMIKGMKKLRGINMPYIDKRLDYIIERMRRYQQHGTVSNVFD